MRYSWLGVECRMFWWCWRTREFLRRQKIQSQSGLEYGMLSSWQCPCAQRVCEASTDRSFLGGDWESTPRCCWWSCSWGWGYPRDMSPRLWQQFVSQGLAQFPPIFQKDVLPWCARLTCLNSRGRLCRTGWREDLGKSGKQRACLRWAHIVHRRALGRDGHVILLQDWSRQISRSPWYRFKACRYFRRWVLHGLEWGLLNRIGCTCSW